MRAIPVFTDDELITMLTRYRVLVAQKQQTAAEHYECSQLMQAIFDAGLDFAIDHEHEWGDPDCTPEQAVQRRRQEQHGMSDAGIIESINEFRATQDSTVREHLKGELEARVEGIRELLRDPTCALSAEEVLAKVRSGTRVFAL